MIYHFMQIKNFFFLLTCHIVFTLNKMFNYLEYKNVRIEKKRLCDIYLYIIYFNVERRLHYYVREHSQVNRLIQEEAH